MHFQRAEKFIKLNGLYSQIEHIQSELKELIDAFFHEPSGRVAEEAFDLIHSVETLLLILEEKHGVVLDAVRDHVKSKNAVRGYYS